jgi:hypothetical protein
MSGHGESPNSTNLSGIAADYMWKTQADMQRNRIIGLFGNLTGWILEKKVGSKALDFVFRLYFQLVYVSAPLLRRNSCCRLITTPVYTACVLRGRIQIADMQGFTLAKPFGPQRTLFARLRKAEQFLYIQLLSSIWIITFYPAYMSRTAYRLFKWLLGAERSYADHAESVATTLYIRNLSENVTMVA